MAEYTRKIKVRNNSGFDTIYPHTKVSAIEDMADALDSYRESFIDPFMVKSVNEILPDEKGNVDIKGLIPVKFNLTSQMDGVTQTFDIDESIVEGTHTVLYYSGVRFEIPYNYTIDYDAHTLTTLFDNAPDNLKNRRLILVAFIDDSTGFDVSEGVKDVLAHGSTVVDKYGVADLDFTATNIFYDNMQEAELKAANVQDAICEMDVNWRYNATFPEDFTVASAPHGMRRGYNWVIKTPSPFTQKQNYSRYLYDNINDALEDTTGSPNINKAVAHWVIDGYLMYFEFISGGNVTTVVYLVNVSNVVLSKIFRPIPIGGEWFFGAIQADLFPTDQPVKSMFDWNVPMLVGMLGNTFDLETTNKQIVAAINEVFAKRAQVEVYEASDDNDAEQYSIANPFAIVFTSFS